MNLVFHIFRKDVRRLWLEISVSLAALVVYLANQWQWIGFTPEDEPHFNTRALGLLLVLTWALLIVRLIQAEPLLAGC